MGSANVDLVRSIYAGWERGDFSSVDWADQDIEYVRADGPAPGSWRGFARIAEAMRDFMNAWTELRVIAEDYRELDGERVLVLVHASGRGKASGLDLGEMGKAAQLFHVQDGKVTRLVTYYDRDRALVDLGRFGA